jgi:hypothetical protein
MRPSTAPAFPSSATLLVEFGGALLGGVVGGALGYLGSFFLFGGAGLGMGLLVAQIFGAIVGFGVGAGVGAALAGRALGQAGNLWLALLGGALVGAVAALVLRYANLGIGLFLWPVVAAPLVAAGAVAGFNVRRPAPTL